MLLMQLNSAKRQLQQPEKTEKMSDAGIKCSMHLIVKTKKRNIENPF